MNRVFLDTGYLIALEASDDQHHEQALEHWQVFKKQLPLLVTTSYIFDETTTFFNSCDKHAKAVEIGELLLQSTTVEFIHIGNELFESGWKIFKQYSDKRYSLTDCISFVVMEREGKRRFLLTANPSWPLPQKSVRLTRRKFAQVLTLSKIPGFAKLSFNEMFWCKVHSGGRVSGRSNHRYNASG